MTNQMQQTFPCPGCGTPTASGQRFCPGCGRILSANCPYCGTALTPEARFCPNCGGAMSASGPQQPAWGPHPGWAPPAASRQPLSRTQLLIILLVVLLLGLGAIAIWQFGYQASPADGTPSIISGVRVASKGNTSASIVWNTDKASSSQVEYGRTAKYGSLAPAQPRNDPTLGSPGVVSHAVTLTGLMSGTNYHYRVRSKDAAGNEAVSAIDRTFRTTEPERHRWDF